jgi:hypothetical protein
MRNWLARLAFPFLVLAFAAAWEGYRVRTGQVPGAGQARAIAYFAGAALLLGLGLRGVRERHRGE